MTLLYLVGKLPKFIVNIVMLCGVFTDLMKNYRLACIRQFPSMTPPKDLPNTCICYKAFLST